MPGYCQHPTPPQYGEDSRLNSIQRLLYEWDFHNNTDLHCSSRSIVSLQHQVVVLLEEKQELEWRLDNLNRSNTALQSIICQLNMENEKLRNASNWASNPLNTASIRLYQTALA
jgi:hypothetical protein